MKDRSFLLSTVSKFGSVMCLLMPYASAAWASEPPMSPVASDTASASQGPADIVVTANKREQRLMDVGLSVAVIDDSALKTQNINDLGDLANIVPGFSAGYSGYSTPIYSLRGIGVNEPTLASKSSVAVYLDEVPYTLPVMTRGATLDLERVEVVKGPQGTLYGSNATGGAINYIANKPTDTLQMGVNGTYGRYNDLSLEGFISGPLANALNGRLAVRAERQFDGWQKSVSRPGDRLGEVRKYQGRMILEWNPGSGTRVVLNANGWIDKSDTQAPQAVQWVGSGGNGTPLSYEQVQNAPAIYAPLNQPDHRPLVMPNDPRAADWDAFRRFRSDDWFWQGSLRADFSISDELNVTSITSYAQARVNALNEADGIGTSLFPASLGEDVNNTAYLGNGKVKTFTQEVRLSANVGPLNWVLGANYEHNNVFDSQLAYDTLFPAVNFLPGGGFTLAIGKNEQKIRAWAVFTNVDIAITDRISLIGGLRLSEERRTFSGCSADAGDGAAAKTFNTIYGLSGANAIQPGGCFSANANGPGLYQATLKEDNVPWNVGINFKPNRDSLIYARISKGYKSGSFPTSVITNNASYFPVKQESVLAYEAGFKANPVRWLNLEGAAFYYDYRNKQQRGRELTGFGLVAKQVNVPKSRIVGQEMTVNLQPVEGLKIGASAVHLDSKIKDYNGYNIDGFFGDLSGAPLPFVPKYNVNANINYTMAVSGDLNAFVGGDMAYRSRATAQIAANSRWDIDPYTIFNAQLGVSSRDDRWRAWIWGKNITNKLYWVNVVKSGEMATRYTAMGATYGLGFMYKF
ncbi:MAG: TonB-dependent receptor [Sphingobium sp.]